MSDSNKTTYLPSEMAEEIDSLRAQYHRNMEDLVAEALALGMSDASIGDLVRVASVDANGKPTSWRKAPLCEIRTNPNLLDNWYFVGGGSQQGDGIFPINQRGLGQYSGAGYYIDRWKCQSNGALTLNSDYITFTGNGLNLEQPLSKGQLLKIKGKTVTAAVYLSDGELVSGTCTWPDIPAESWTYEYVAVSSRVLLVVGTSYLQEANLFIQSRIAEGINIKAIKLELGAEQTLAHQENGQLVLNEIPDYDEQLYRCCTSTADSNDTYANRTVCYSRNLQNTITLTEDPAVSPFTHYGGWNLYSLLKPGEKVISAAARSTEAAIPMVCTINSGRDYISVIGTKASAIVMATVAKT